MDNKVLDEAVEVALTAYVNSRGSYEGEVPASSDDIRAALLAGVKVLLGEPVAWQKRYAVLPCSGNGWRQFSDWEETTPVNAQNIRICREHGDISKESRRLYAPSLGEGDGR